MSAPRKPWGSSQRRALLVYIDAHWFRNGASPSYSHCAAVFGVNASTVRHACEQLERERLVVVTKTDVGQTAKRTIRHIVITVTDEGRRVAHRTRWRRSLDTPHDGTDDAE